MTVFKRRRAEFNAAFVAALLRRDEHVTNAYIRVRGGTVDWHPAHANACLMLAPTAANRHES